MGLFSKEECCFCNKKVGILARKKLRDKKYICKDCEKNCSAFIDISKFDSEYVKQHFEYMKKQDVLYRQAFEPLSKEEKLRTFYQFNGIVFADSIAMFEVITPKTEKKNFKELFRYDQIKDYEIYSVLNNQEGGKKYSEVGVIINLYCKIGTDSVGITEQEKTMGHPYVEKIKICYGKNVSSDLCVKDAINHLDEIFLREPRFKSFARGIKESFTGTETERRNMKQSADAINALAGLAKAKFSGDANSMETAKENIKDTIVSTVNLASGNRLKYKEVADSVEKRIWGQL